MRIHLTRQGARTSISVDDYLILYLVKRLYKQKNWPTSALSKEMKTKARLWIQIRVDAAADSLPANGVSQWVQARIVDSITDPSLKSPAMIAQEAELNGCVKALYDLRYKEWQDAETERENMVKQRELYESIARDTMKKTAKYKAPPEMAV